MKEEQDYIRDITEIRSMMERSSKFLTLSGWAGIMAGIYAITGAYIAYTLLHFNPAEIVDNTVSSSQVPADLLKVFLVAISIIILALSTAIYLSYSRAKKSGEKLWNATARRLVINMAVPLVAGGLLILILISKGLIGLIAPMSLLFYGLALYNASKFTYEEVKILGLTQLGLGLISCYFVEYGLLFWAIGFGLVHIIYGIYMHYTYER
jgi:hypothetical protein